MLKVLDVDGAVRRVKGGWTATGEPWTYDAERYAWVARQRAAEQQAMRDYVATTGLPDGVPAAAVGRRGSRPVRALRQLRGSPVHGRRLRRGTGRGARRAGPRRVSRSSPARCGRPGCRRSGVNLKGRIPAGEQATPGRALGRLSDIGWGNRLRPMLAPQAPDGPVPDDVAKAVVAVLADWAKGPGGWAAGQADAQPRPVGVVTMASRTRPQLIGSLGARIAEIGRMPLLGIGGVHRARSPRSPAATAHSGSRRSHGALTVPPELAVALAEADGPVLLVDDVTETGWTLAVAARLLRRAGARGGVAAGPRRPGVTDRQPDGGTGPPGRCRRVPCAGI